MKSAESPLLEGDAVESGTEAACYLKPDLWLEQEVVQAAGLCHWVPWGNPSHVAEGGSVATPGP